MGIGTGLGVAGIASAAIGAGTSLAAAGTQSDAANNAANLQAQEAQNSLDFQKQQWATQQQNEAPFLATGQAAATQLGQDLAPGGSLMQPWTQQFQAPTAATEQNDPGYQFRLQQGQQALENSASARGGLLGGNTAVAEQQYGQNYASNEYQNVYERALGQYQQQYNIFQNNQANQFNRLSAASGGGQVAAGQLGQQGQSAASTVAGINTAAGQQIGNSIQNAAAARASGYVGAGNAISGGLTSLSQAQLLAMLLQNQGSSNPAASAGGIP